MLKKIKGLLIPLVMLVLGFQFLGDYFSSDISNAKEKYETLIAKGQNTVATLNPEYEETTVKIAGLPIKTYKVGYSFLVDGKKYTGEKSLKAPPTAPIMEVTFLPDNPTVNTINPQEELQSATETEEGKGALYIGLVLFLLGLWLLYARAKQLIKPNAASTTAENKKAENTSDIEQETEMENELKNNPADRKTAESDHSRFMPKVPKQQTEIQDSADIKSTNKGDTSIK